MHFDTTEQCFSTKLGYLINCAERINSLLNN